MLAGRGEKSDILSPVLLHAVKIFIWVLPEGVVKVPRLKREISADIRFTCFLSKSQYFMIIKDYLSIKGGKKEEGCYINKVKKKKKHWKEAEALCPGPCFTKCSGKDFNM